MPNASQKPAAPCPAPDRDKIRLAVTTPGSGADVADYSGLSYPPGARPH